MVEGLFERLSEENLVRQKLNLILSWLLVSEIFGMSLHLLECSTFDESVLLQNNQEMGRAGSIQGAEMLQADLPVHG